jgi:hypothetical protein
MWRLAIGAVVGCALGAAGILAILDRPASTRSDAPPARAPSPRPVVEHPAAPRCRAGSVLATGTPTSAVAARVQRPTSALRAPEGHPFRSFGLTNENGVRTVFAVLARRVDGSCRTTWLRVQLPVRPNGAKGWVRARDVELFRVPARVVVDLSQRRVTVYRRGAVVLRAVAAIGTPATPTPTGRFYVNQRLLAANPRGVWGPGGVGISAFSPTLVNWTQGGPIAIHGTDRPELLGSRVSHGCVRVRNDVLRKLMRLAPEGTPVEIRS